MRKTAILFPGQGSQYIGMGKMLSNISLIVEDVFEEASDILGFDLKMMCFEGSLDDLTKTENAQPSILTCSVSAFKVLQEEIDIKPEYLVGHSLGEISALVCSGAIKFSDAIRLVRKRGMLMQQAADNEIGKMAVIESLDSRVVSELCKEISCEGNIVVISNYNSKSQVVISGNKNAVSLLCEKTLAMGASVIPLKVSAPFHSPLMRKVTNEFKDELSKFNFHKFKWPVISNVSGLPYTEPNMIIENLTAQIEQPVQWHYSMEFLQKQEIEITIDVGPKDILKNLNKTNMPDAKHFSYDKKEDREVLKQVFYSKNQDDNYSRISTKIFLSRCLAIAVCTRNRNWDDEEYKKGVIEPYRKVQKIQEQIEKESREPTKEEMLEALEMLHSVFNTKKVPLVERIERFNQVFDETDTRDIFDDFLISHQ